jgi:beta-xylosidase
MQGDKIIWKADLENGSFQNPILYSDYSDPDVIRVNDTYYMTASSFNYIPGLPILLSKDLVNWELCNYAIDNISYDTYSNPAHGKGVWAPSIRFHDNKFWIFYGMPDEGVFMVNTEDPLGKWSDPICVREGKGFIDPCPFWDENGKAYIVHAYAKSRIGFKSKLGIFEISWDGKTTLSEDTFIFDGTITQPTIEGPKVYKKFGYYYIFSPAGGVTNGWQTVLRSTNIYGPYEERIVMHQGSTAINGPHQGGLVDTDTGEEWFVHFQDAGYMGRITHLQPVRWENDWPIIGVEIKKTGIGQPVLTHKKPDIVSKINTNPLYLEASDEFNGSKLNLLWQWMGNYNSGFFSLLEEIGKLTLYSRFVEGIDPVLWNYSNVLTQKLIYPTFRAEVKLDFTSLKEGEMGGFALIGNQYAFISVKKDEDNTKIQYVESYDENNLKKEKVVFEQMVENKNPIVFRIVINERKEAMFQYELSNNESITLDSIFIPQEGTWVGAKLGLFSISKTMKELYGNTKFDYINVTSLNEE